MNKCAFSGYIDPYQLAQQNEEISGSIPLSELPMVKDLLLESSGNVRVLMKFQMDSNYRSCVKGTIETQVVQQCQRCLEPISTSINSSFEFIFVKEQSLETDDSEDSQTLLTENDQIRLATIIEDEMILNINIYAKHQLKECINNNTMDILTKNIEDFRRAKNPFAVLEQLK